MPLLSPDLSHFLSSLLFTFPSPDRSRFPGGYLLPEPSKLPIADLKHDLRPDQMNRLSQYLFADLFTGGKKSCALPAAFQRLSVHLTATSFSGLAIACVVSSIPAAGLAAGDDLGSL